MSELKCLFTNFNIINSFQITNGSIREETELVSMQNFVNIIS